jgi:excisionase family DNA binding protein
VFEHDGVIYPATITVAQASELTGLSLRATYRAVEAGHIPHIRFGQRILIQTAKLFELLGLESRTSVPRG